jgi:type I restriction enzyme M protein
MFVRDLDEMDNTRKKDSLMLGLSYKSIFEDKENLKGSALRDKPADILRVVNIKE